MLKLFAVFFLIFLFSKIFSSQTKDRSYDLKDENFHQLPSNSTLSLPAGYLVIIGDDAKNYMDQPYNSNLEAVVYDETKQHSIVFENANTGYISLDNWESIDSNLLLEGIQISTESMNIERRLQGLSDVHLMGWHKKPTLDRKTNTIYWSTEAECLNERSVNAIALKLGRKGYEKFKWVYYSHSGEPEYDHLEIMLNSHKFKPGFDYSDYKIGDKLANGGIATVITENCGANLTEEEKQIEEGRQAFFGLDWKKEGRYQFSESHSTLVLPTGYYLLLDEEAKKARKIIGGDLESPNLEALVCDESYQQCILFETIKDGYISIDDWENIDTDTLLKEIGEGTKEANGERRKLGFIEIHVVGWIKKPYFDKETKTVYWTIGFASENQENFVNATALKLGRESYEMIIWIADKNSYLQNDTHLATILKSYSFDQGFKYEDYSIGDRMADYGIATLVAATAGGKLLKATGILIFLKKFTGIILAAIAACYFKIKEFFNSKKKKSQNFF